MGISHAENAKALASLPVQTIEIKSDGSVEGTTLTINGKAVANLEGIHLYLSKGGIYEELSLRFCTGDPGGEPTPGVFSESHSFYLTPHSESPGSAEASAKGRSLVTTPGTDPGLISQQAAQAIFKGM